MEYRKEIDGLRALAVVPVVFAHAGLPLAKGGYIGVDVFFVISGYLITTIILSEIESGKFSIVNFYERRARRILPVLFAVILVCIPFAVIFMVPNQLVSFSKSVTSATVFFSNFLFWSESGYFAEASKYKPLLHTWSLSIEEQYYLLFPAFLMVFSKFGNSKIILLIFVFTVCSFSAVFFEEYLTEKPGIFAYFMTFTRIWVLFTGSLIAFYLYKKEKIIPTTYSNVLSAIGVLLIIYAVVSFNESTPYPSLYSLFPVLGTSLIILFCQKQTIIGKILSWKYFVGIGLISYSLYMWHYPVLVFFRLSSEELLDSHKYEIILLIFLISILSYFYIEKPFRDKKRISKNGLLLRIGIVFSAVMFFSVCGVMSNGFINLYPKEDRYLFEIKYKEQGEYVNYHRNRLLYKPFSDNDKRKKMFLIGDSYVGDFINMGYESKFLNNYQVSTHVINNKCGIYLGNADIANYHGKHIESICNKRRFNKESYLFIRSADIIVLCAYWREWTAKHLLETIENLKLRKDQKLLVIGSKNFGTIRPKEYVGLSSREKQQIRYKIPKRDRETNKTLRKSIKVDDFLDIQRLVCNNDEICHIFTPSNKLISYDGGHITKEGAIYIGNILSKHHIIKDL